MTLCSCFGLMIMFWLLTGTVVSVPQDHSDTSQLTQGFSQHLQQTHTPGYHRPDHLPFDRDEVPLEPETPDEVESNDNVKEDLSKVSWALSAEKKFNVSLARRLLLQLQLSIESRSKISLFILHHSWKSYLS